MSQTDSPASRPAILFVCLGNICRSPLAEAALRHEAARAGFDVLVDSAGTGSWHIGNAPDPRARAEALRHGIDISSYQARQVGADDFDRFDLIVAMDNSNLGNLRRLAPSRPGGARASLSLMLDHVPGMAGRDVEDPYFGGPEGFVTTWEQVTAGARGLIAALQKA
ncbi:low molecular weight protein-tyrosine-phosphatase [Novosphingobium clariflavum]|uniref:protein-tyrosine-phosphatase n=1 Tax=Novosphingobium clariflavum TaxID=2029884 RepID=A0ABV6SCG8_9SPHN|nr:low molecular weight protein-tyrosine-phosphatase [Novosphingobium clariflavum]